MFQRLARNFSRDGGGETSPQRRSSSSALSLLCRQRSSESKREPKDNNGSNKSPFRQRQRSGDLASSEVESPSSSFDGKHVGSGAVTSSSSAAEASATNSSQREEHSQFKMPELEKWIRSKDAERHGAAAIEVCARVQRHELENYGVSDLAWICRQLGFEEEWCRRYAKVMEDNAIDGWLFLEIVDWEDYAEMGVRKDHAVALCAVAKGVKGDFGYAIPREPASAKAERLRHRRRARLTESEERQLDQADRLAEQTGEGAVYGQLVVLGHKEYRVEGSTWHPVGPRNEKFELRRRKHANGIRRADAYSGPAPQKSSTSDKLHSSSTNKKKRSTDASHSVTMSVAGTRDADGKITEPQRVTVEYVPDARHDMFQLGRMIVPQNDFVVRGPLHLDAGGILCGPVSRYACRLSCSRLPPYRCTLYAAGFNQERDIFLSEIAPKWQLAPGEVAADDPRGPSTCQRTRTERGATPVEEDHRANSCSFSMTDPGYPRGEGPSINVAGRKDDDEDYSSSPCRRRDCKDDDDDDEPATTKAPRRRLDADLPSVNPREEPSNVSQWDALTTFGVRIWKPEIGEWREVSVHGGVHEPRERGDVAGERYPDEDSVLTDGTIVDLAGIQLLFESASSMREHERAEKAGERRELSPSSSLSSGAARSPLEVDLEGLSAPNRIVARFNARKPHCPVLLHRVRLEYDEEKRKALADDRRPFIFTNCGHVYAYASEFAR